MILMNKHKIRKILSILLILAIMLTTAACRRASEDNEPSLPTAPAASAANPVSTSSAANPASASSAADPTSAQSSADATLVNEPDVSLNNAAKASDGPIILKIYGDGVYGDTSWTLGDLKAEPGSYREFTYSTVNNWPSFGAMDAMGVSLYDVLKTAGLNGKAESFIFKSTDGYYATLTYDQVFGEQYSYTEQTFAGYVASFAGGVSADDTGGGAAYRIEPILAWAWGDAGKARDENLRPFFGQAGPWDVNTSAFVKNLCEIEVSSEPAGVWEAPSIAVTKIDAADDGFNPETGAADGGALLEFAHDDMDNIRIYYTLDGGEPDYDSPVYNKSTSYFQPQLIQPLYIIENTTIKAFAAGIGKERSRTVSYLFTIDEVNGDADITPLPDVSQLLNISQKEGISKQPDISYASDISQQANNRKSADISRQSETASQTDITVLFFSDTQADPVNCDYTGFSELLADAAAFAGTPDVVILGGDTVNDGGDADEWRNFWAATGQSLTGGDAVSGARTPRPITAAAPGNHDDNAMLAEQFDFPNAAPAAQGEGYFYSLNYGPIHFIILDSSIMGAANERDADWLAHDLSGEDARNASWRVAVMHHPMWPVTENPKDAARAATMRETFLPLMEAGGIDLILCGHQHTYSRSLPMRTDTAASNNDVKAASDDNDKATTGDNDKTTPAKNSEAAPAKNSEAAPGDVGIVQIMAASGCKESYAPGPFDYMATVSDAPNYVLLKADESSLRITAYNRVGERIDAYVIGRKP